MIEGGEISLPPQVTQPEIDTPQLNAVAPPTQEMPLDGAAPAAVENIDPLSAADTLQKFQDLSPEQKKEYFEAWKQEQEAAKPTEQEVDGEPWKKEKAAWNGTDPPDPNNPGGLHLVIRAAAEHLWTTEANAVIAALRSRGMLQENLPPADQQTLIDAEVKRRSEINTAAEQLKLVHDTPKENIKEKEDDLIATIIIEGKDPVVVKKKEAQKRVLMGLRELAEEKGTDGAPSERAKQAQEYLDTLKPHVTPEGHIVLKTPELLAQEAAFEAGVDVLDGMLAHVGGIPKKIEVDKNGKKTETIDWEAIAKLDPDSATSRLQILLVSQHRLQNPAESKRLPVRDSAATQKMLSGAILEEIFSLRPENMHPPNEALAQRITSIYIDKSMTRLRQDGMNVLREKMKSIISIAYDHDVPGIPMRDSHIIRDLLMVHALKGNAIKLTQGGDGKSRLTFQSSEAEKFAKQIVLSGRANENEMQAMKTMVWAEQDTNGQKPLQMLLSQELGFDIQRLEQNNATEAYAGDAVILIRDQRIRQGREALTPVQMDRYKKTMTDLVHHDIQKFKDKKKPFLSGGGLLLMAGMGIQFLPQLLHDPTIDGETGGGSGGGH